MRTRVEVRSHQPLILHHAHEAGEVAGGRISLACTAQGIPPPAIKFKFGADEYTGRPAEPGEVAEAVPGGAKVQAANSNISNNNSNNSTTSVLDVRNLGPANEGEYTCLAVNEYGSDQASTQLHVYARTQILKGPSDRVLESGEAVTMPCRVSVSLS